MNKIIYSTLRLDPESNVIYSQSNNLNLDGYGILHALIPEIMTFLPDSEDERLVWDDTKGRSYETGVDRGVLYLIDVDGRYSTGVAWNGLISITESPSGAEATKIYADNGKYVELRSLEELGGTIEAYTYPDEFAKCDGSVALTSGLYAGQQFRKTFGLSYRTRIGDSGAYKLHLIYGCVASPSERSYTTINDSPEAVSFSWDYTTMSNKIPGYKSTSSLIIDSAKVNLKKLRELEDVLYGSFSSAARLPFPNEVASILIGREVTDA